MVYWFAGRLYEEEQIAIGVKHPALTYGASVFTTMRVYERTLEHPLTAFREHRDRISNSLKAFNWSQPNWNSIIQGLQPLLTEYPVLRLNVFSDGQELITGRLLPANLSQQQKTGVTLWVAQGLNYQRSMPAHKTSNYLACLLAMQAAKDHGARDAILVNPAGEWLETSTGNLWGYKFGQWWTPSLDAGILPGISRARMLGNLGCQAISHLAWDFDVIQTFESLAYSNCVVEIMPVHTVLFGNIKLNYRSTHEGLSLLRRMFYGPFMDKHSCEAE